jgi:SAM-dependent methyltransferase
VRPRVTRDALPTLYPPDYFDQDAQFGYGDYAREAQRRVREAFFLVKRVRRHGPDPRVLEVGCALGFLLSALREKGCRVNGVDASPFAAYYAQTRLHLPVVCGTLEDARFPDAAFDFVVQKDLLEHTLHPRRHLVETCRVMRGGGELWLVTPNGEANLRPLVRHRSPSGSTGELPLLDQGHLSCFSLSHLRRLFDECGFEVVRARVIGVRRGLRALGVVPGQHRFSRGVHREKRPAAPTGGVSATEGTDGFDERATRIESAVHEHDTWLRRWRPYYYVHRLGKRLDAWPASTGVGYDFEFVLKKR